MLMKMCHIFSSSYACLTMSMDYIQDSSGAKFQQYFRLSPLYPVPTLHRDNTGFGVSSETIIETLSILDETFPLYSLLLVVQRYPSLRFERAL